MEEITQKKLNKMLKLHELWLRGKAKGIRLDLSNKNISNLNMQEADMRWADMQGAKMQGAKMQKANMQEANMQEADMRWANMQEANMQGAKMQGADMQGADIDFSCWPLWCGSLGVKLDKKQKIQLGYHFANVLDNNDPEEKALKKALRPFVNRFHRIPEVNKI